MTDILRFQHGEWQPVPVELTESFTRGYLLQDKSRSGARRIVRQFRTDSGEGRSEISDRLGGRCKRGQAEFMHEHADRTHGAGSADAAGTAGLFRCGCTLGYLLHRICRMMLHLHGEMRNMRCTVSVRIRRLSRRRRSCSMPTFTRHEFSGYRMQGQRQHQKNQQESLQSFHGLKPCTGRETEGPGQATFCSCKTARTSPVGKPM